VKTSVWRFGEAQFDETQGSLTVAGKPVELDRNCVAILSVLLQEAGREVAKERLLQAGWPDRIVHENSLAKAVGRLRKVLARDGRSIETLYGRGYRFNGTPERVASQEMPGFATQPVWPAKPGRWAVGRPALAVIAAVLAVAAIGSAYYWSRAEATQEQPYRTAPPIIADAPDVIGRVLWVDDHPQNNIYEKQFFEARRIAVHTTRTSADALRLLSMYDYDIVISDMGRGEDRLAGLKLVEQMRALEDETPLIIYTVRPDGEDDQRAQRRLVSDAGAQGVVVTPGEVRSAILRFFGNPGERVLD
jgi:DNA-binding response OmpR family regulator